MEQPGLNFVAKSADQAAKLEADFYMVLANTHPAWIYGRLLCGMLGTNERVLRQIADRSQGRVISGPKGYKLTQYATVEEVDHAERRLISQANKMRERAVEIRRARNQGGRAA